MILMNRYNIIYNKLYNIARNSEPKEVCDWPVAIHVTDLS